MKGVLKALPFDQAEVVSWQVLLRKENERERVDAKLDLPRVSLFSSISPT